LRAGQLPTALSRVNRFGKSPTFRVTSENSAAADFLSTPIYVSAGHDDRIATLEQQYAVVGSIKRTGFNRVRIGTFRGGHEVNDAQTSIALRWFRTLQK